MACLSSYHYCLPPTCTSCFRKLRSTRGCFLWHGPHDIVHERMNEFICQQSKVGGKPRKVEPTITQNANTHKNTTINDEESQKNSSPTLFMNLDKHVLKLEVLVVNATPSGSLFQPLTTWWWNRFVSRILCVIKDAINFLSRLLFEGTLLDFLLLVSICISIFFGIKLSCFLLALNKRMWMNEWMNEWMKMSELLLFITNTFHYWFHRKLLRCFSSGSGWSACLRVLGSLALLLTALCCAVDGFLEAGPSLSSQTGRGQNHLSASGFGKCLFLSTVKEYRIHYYVNCQPYFVGRQQRTNNKYDRDSAVKQKIKTTIT